MHFKTIFDQTAKNSHPFQCTNTHDELICLYIFLAGLFLCFSNSSSPLVLPRFLDYKLPSLR